MSDWRELIDENSNKKTESNNSNNSKKPSKNPENPNIAIFADIALRSESEFLPIATDRLKEIAGDILWSADDLLDWFKSDYEELARSSLDQVKFLVADYLNNIDLLRGEDTHIAKMMNPYHVVVCSQCQHWTRDDIAAGGIGCCSLHASPNLPAFPHAPRRCFEFQEI